MGLIHGSNKRNKECVWKFREEVPGKSLGYNIVNNVKMKMGCEDGSGWNWLGVMFCRSGEFPDSVTRWLTLKLHYEKQLL